MVINVLRSVFRQSVAFFAYTFLFCMILTDDSRDAQFVFTIFFYVIATVHVAVAFLKMESDKEHHNYDKPWTWADVITVLAFILLYLVFQDKINEAVQRFFIFNM